MYILEYIRRSPVTIASVDFVLKREVFNWKAMPPIDDFITFEILEHRYEEEACLDYEEEHYWGWVEDLVDSDEEQYSYSL